MVGKFKGTLRTILTTTDPDGRVIKPSPAPAIDVDITVTAASQSVAATYTDENDEVVTITITNDTWEEEKKIVTTVSGEPTEVAGGVGLVVVSTEPQEVKVDDER